MYGIPKHKRKITPQKLIKIFQEYDEQISLEEASLVLDLMYDFAKLALNQHLQKLSEGHGPADSPLCTRAK